MGSRKLAGREAAKDKVKTRNLRKQKARHPEDKSQNRL